MVTGSVPGWGTYLGCGFGPPLGHMQEATINVCFPLFLTSLPLSLESIKENNFFKGQFYVCEFYLDRKKKKNEPRLDYINLCTNIVIKYNFFFKFRKAPIRPKCQSPHVTMQTQRNTPSPEAVGRKRRAWGGERRQRGWGTARAADSSEGLTVGQGPCRPLQSRSKLSKVPVESQEN